MNADFFHCAQSASVFSGATIAALQTATIASLFTDSPVTFYTFL